MRIVWLSAALALQLSAASRAETQPPRFESARFVGSVGCKSSSCHGGAGEQRSQYITWVRHDVHTRAFAILTDARSERIADTLNLPAVQEGFSRATTSARCTICHSPFDAIPPAQRSSNLDASEGVSCEQCHGAAGGWLRGHTRLDWTYATRVGAGMRDLKNLYVRANTCVACHQNLDADIAAAGHPPLVFELDGQSVAEPKHWRDESGAGPRSWLVGQAVALRELSWHLATSPSPNPQAREQWRALSWLLSRVTAAETRLPPINDASSFPSQQSQADVLARRASQLEIHSDSAERLARSLAELAPEFTETPQITRELLFLRAERLVLALDRLRNGPTSPAFVALRSSIATPVEFDVKRFAERLRNYRESLAH